MVSYEFEEKIIFIVKCVLFYFKSSKQLSPVAKLRNFAMSNPVEALFLSGRIKSGTVNCQGKGHIARTSLSSNS